MKQSIPETAEIFTSSDYNDAIKNFAKLEDCVLKLERGSNIFNRFECELHLKGYKSVFQVKTENFLYRGSKLINTEWVLAMVVHAGLNCKIFQNRP